MPHVRDMEVLTTAEAFNKLTVDQLKVLVRLLGVEPPQRKADLVEILTRTMLEPERVRELYEGLDEISKLAVQEAVHDPDGRLHLGPFAAKHRHNPDFGKRDSGYRNPARPTALALFFPELYRHVLPSDLKDILEKFVPEPPPVAISAGDDLPAGILQTWHSWNSGNKETKEIPLRVRDSAAEALHDVKAVLQLVDAGAIKIGAKLHRPTAAAMKALALVLDNGDFYTAEDGEECDPDDLVIKPYAWPMLVQAARLAEVSGSRLRLTPAGRKATAQPAADVIRAIWSKWQNTALVDEFNRVDLIKGQKGHLSAVAPRRAALIDVLTQCPPEKWLAIDEVFRLVKGLAPDLQVSRDAWGLYLCEKQYGSLGFDGAHYWELLAGRYVLAFLFEYAATLGLVDVAYISPVDARDDYTDRWGTDDLAYLSRYDGLQFVRINPLGAWCLGLAERYQPEAVPAEPLVKVLPNLDIVCSDRPLPAADRLFLDRFAEPRSEAVWHLTAARVLQAVAEGHSVSALVDFLAAKAADRLPQTVQSFLDDVQRQSRLLRDCGPARLIECADAAVAQTLAHDRRLRALCHLAGERHLVFRAADEKAFLRGLRELNYVLPRQE
jgi:hypothetical protein